MIWRLLVLYYYPPPLRHQIHSNFHFMFNRNRGIFFIVIPFIPYFVHKIRHNYAISLLATVTITIASSAKIKINGIFAKFISGFNETWDWLVVGLTAYEFS